jgi:hypothetical protein
LVRAEVFQFSFCTFHFSSYLYSAFVPGERNPNSTPAQSATVGSNFMTTTFNKNILEIIPAVGEELFIFRKTIYPDRIVVFKTIDKDALQEIHFDKRSGFLIDRESRKKNFPKSVFKFKEHNIIVIVEHKFLDEIDFKGYKPKGIDIETVIIKAIIDSKEIDLMYQTNATNKSSDNFYELAKESVENYLKNKKFKIDQSLFLKDTYSKLTTKEKVNYHFSEIHFQNRMQGGFPSGYKNPAATYLSKWFIDTFKTYDAEILKTIGMIANEFNIPTTYLNEMIKYEVQSLEWKSYARKLDLLD